MNSTVLITHVGVNEPSVFCFHPSQPNDLQLLQQLGMSEEDQLKLALELSIQGNVMDIADGTNFIAGILAI